MPTNDLDAIERIDRRDVRALTEIMSVLDNVGRARGADDLYLVVSQSGREYLVDTREGVCECPDFEHNLPIERTDGSTRHACKHIARVTYDTGMRPIPAWVDRDALDDQIGVHVTTGRPRVTPDALATDGGRNADTDAVDERPDDCDCVPATDLACWPCYRAGFTTTDTGTDTDTRDAEREIEAERDAERRAERALERGEWGAGGGR